MTQRRKIEIIVIIIILSVHLQAWDVKVRIKIPTCTT